MGNDFQRIISQVEVEGAGLQRVKCPALLEGSAATSVPEVSGVCHRRRRRRRVMHIQVLIHVRWRKVFTLKIHLNKKILFPNGKHEIFTLEKSDYNTAFSTPVAAPWSDGGGGGGGGSSRGRVVQPKPTHTP